MTHWHATYITIQQLNDGTELRTQHRVTCRTKKELNATLEEKGAIRSWCERRCNDAACTESK